MKRLALLFCLIAGPAFAQLGLPAGIGQVSTPSAISPGAPVLSGVTVYGSSPAVTNAPMHQVSSSTVATVPNSGGTPTSCNVTAGDPSGNFQCVVSGGAVRITYTSAGASNLTGSSDLVQQALTVTATNGSGTSPGVSVPVNVYADGALQAPAGTPQFPAALGSRFTGTITGSTNLTVTNVSSRPIQVGQRLFVVGINQNVTIASGSGANWTLSAGVTNVANQSMTTVYATAVPWLVSGVDYFAGLDPAFTLTPASSAAVSGCTVNSGASPPNITCTGTGKILDKIDFTVSNGYVVIFNGCTNCGITNSKFGGTNYNNPPLTSTIIVLTNTASPGFTFTGNDFDGGCSTTSGASQLLLQGGGTTIYQHNYSHRRPQHVLEFSTNSGVLNRAWNLIEGGGCSVSSHGNILQWGGGAATPTVRFETFNWGPNTYAGLQSEVYQFYQFNPGTMTNPVLKYGTIIVPSTANPGISYATHWWADPPTIRSGIMTMTNMYMDMGGNAGVRAFGSLYRAGSCSDTAPTSISGNIDLNTGGALAIGDVVVGGC